MSNYFIYKSCAYEFVLIANEFYEIKSANKGSEFQTHSPQSMNTLNDSHIWSQVFRLSFSNLIVNLIIVQFLTIKNNYYYYFVWLTLQTFSKQTKLDHFNDCALSSEEFRFRFSTTFFSTDNSKLTEKNCREKLTARTAPTIQTFSMFDTD